MRFIVLLATPMLLFSSCHESEVSIEVTKTRRVTYFDQQPPRDILDKPPLGWRSIPATQFRDINFLAGKDESVQIYASTAQGGVLANANRWLGQFGLDPVGDPRAFDTVMILSLRSIVVDASGNFDSGRGEVEEDYGLVGAIREASEGLFTLKMIGPAEEVAKLRPEFLAYCESMRITEVADLEDEEESKEESE